MMYAKFILTLLLILSAALNAENTSPFQVPTGPRLKATVKIAAISSPEKDEPHKVMPGSLIALAAVVKNTGDQVSPTGKIFIRFTFPPPLDSQPNNILFETEKRDLPAILPNKSATIEFSKTHQWPSVFDFLRQDWHMREYEVVAIIDNKEEAIGHASIAVSAQYSIRDGF